ncbi:hypothetical protein ACHAXR_001236, partial [Thalassiosira sp. AJA248-18]
MEQRGQDGVDGNQLKNWLLRHEVHSERLREEMAHWVSWLANESPPYAAYRALNAMRELPADKRPGVRPLGCGEIWMRLIADCDHEQSKSGATIACGNTQLCAGLKSGIEANLHAVRAIWPQSAGWTHDSGVESDGDEEALPTTEEVHPAAMVPQDPTVDPGAAVDDSRSRYTPNTGHGAALFDAKMASTCSTAHLWNKGSRFTFNRYRHWGICIVRTKPGDPAIVIHSKEGITQGDCRAMSIYGVGLMPLASRMREAIPDALQPWFADDAAGAGKAADNARCLNFLMTHGPKYGYFPEPDKCWYICKAEDEAVAKAAFQQHGLNINYTRGRRYLGGFIGSAETKHQWLGEMVSKWVQAVQTFAQLAPRYPQTVYCGFTFCLQNEW